MQAGQEEWEMMVMTIQEVRGAAIWYVLPSKSRDKVRLSLSCLYY